MAQKASISLRLAGKVDPGADSVYFEERIKPHLNGDDVIYEGEVGGQRKQELPAGARFLPFPIRWEEPFGLVMSEALACGTPVVTDAMGAAPEIVKDGAVGVLVGAGEWDGMAAAIKDGRLDGIDPFYCREYVQERFGVKAMIDGYEAAFQKILAKGD